MCLLHLGITRDGHVVSEAFGIEPEHALALIDEIDAVRARLVEYACNRPDEPRASNVIPLTR